MADSASPQTFVRRAATLPVRLQTPASPRSPLSPTSPNGSSSSSPQSETLFVCPIAKIYSFPASLSRPTTASGPGVQENGTLPWASPTERANAVGPLRLYRLPGSVSFLNSGNLLLSLMPRSQCWCVDGVSKFAMKIKSYIYRVELPYDTEQDQAIVEEFKAILGKIIQYEKTACPFERGFSVDLPDEAVSPARSAKPRGPVSKARRWVTDEGWRPEDVGPEEWRARYLRERSPGGSDEDRASATTDDTNTTQKTSPFPAAADEGDAGSSIRPLHQDAYRNFTLPTKYVFNDADPFRAAQERAALAPSKEMPTPIAGGSGSGMFVPRAKPEPGRVGRMVARHSSLQSPVLAMSLAEDHAVDNAKLAAREEAVLDPVAADSPRDVPIPEEAEGGVKEEAIPNPAETGALDEGPSLNEPLTDVVIPRPLEKEARILQDSNPSAPAVDEQMAAATEAIETNSMDDRQQSLNSMASVQSFHTSRTGLSPRPSYASFMPVLQTIEHDETESTEPGVAVEPALTPPALQTKEKVSSESLPEASPLPMPANAAHPRKGYPIRHKASTSLLASHREIRRQASISFNSIHESQDFTTNVISTAAALLMGPPSGLLAAMMQIATRMTRGAFGPGSSAFRYREGRWKRDGYRWMPGGWESDDEEYLEEERMEAEDNEWDQKTLAGDEDDEEGLASGCETPTQS